MLWTCEYKIILNYGIKFSYFYTSSRGNWLKYFFHDFSFPKLPLRFHFIVEGHAVSLQCSFSLSLSLPSSFILISFCHSPIRICAQCLIRFFKPLRSSSFLIEFFFLIFVFQSFKFMLMRRPTSPSSALDKKIADNPPDRWVFRIYLRIFPFVNFCLLS